MAGPRGSWTREQLDGKTSVSKEEEISTIEKIEGDKMYEAKYIMAQKPQEDYNRGCVGRTQNSRRKENP